MGILKTPEFWVAVSFVGFILLLVYYKIPGMVAGLLDERAEKIRNELEEAKRLREEAQAILADYQRKQRDAAKEADKIIGLAKEEAEALAVETREKMKESLERRTRLAEEKIARAEEQAVADVRAAAIDVAIASAEQIIEKKMTPAASAKLINQSIEGLKGKLN
ncbi:MAG: F0F1 ATP synthase subunit B [Hyphomicrobiales bacterium]|nr:F0F1 ATP synthase subunit B [Hyphomicrobiales bacterium]